MIKKDKIIQIFIVQNAGLYGLSEYGNIYYWDRQRDIPKWIFEIPSPDINEAPI